MNKGRVAVAFGVIIILCLAALVIAEYFKVEEVTVTGSSKYSAEEIEEMVMSGPLGHNSLYLTLKYRNKPITDLPFIARTDVNINSPTSVTINVYEKALAGYVKYLGRYMYFDRDGIIVDSSTEALPGIPYVTGLDFDECVISKPLPVEDPSVFKTILSITQLLEKYEIPAERIYFDGPDNITLYFGNARVIIGSMENIDEKMMKLKSVIDSIRGLSGELHLEDYSLDTDEGYITFEKDE
ncbi:MAG: FtsQ-type POTRA domain-containing protein [Lachnospiraceae bacterium]|nr:FtsQ-type POTRA domain-containing protein [Lachnospiraceae bacterium]